MINIDNRRLSSDDLDIWCQDPKWPPTNFNRRSIFVKKLLTKEIWKIFLFYYINRNFLLWSIFYFPRKATHTPSSPLLGDTQLPHEVAFKVLLKIRCRDGHDLIHANAHSSLFNIWKIRMKWFLRFVNVNMNRTTARVTREKSLRK